MYSLKAQWRKQGESGRRKPVRTAYAPASASARGNGAARRPAENTPLLVAYGTGGRIELMTDHILLIKNHFLGDFINLLGLGYGKVQNSIMIDDISSVAIIRPLVFPDFITFTFPGSPPSTGNVFIDALMGNALIMNLFDNRRFYELKERIHGLHQMRLRS
ncbi:MAG: hypothetical protein HQ483_19430 [Rhodospirillales bacterium]|nr:hypothetical protein [Rhodospirillales bacterium]